MSGYNMMFGALKGWEVTIVIFSVYCRVVGWCAPFLLVTTLLKESKQQILWADIDRWEIYGRSNYPGWVTWYERFLLCEAKDWQVTEIGWFCISSILMGIGSSTVILNLPFQSLETLFSYTVLFDSSHQILSCLF